MGVLKLHAKDDRMKYFLENLSFWKFDIIKYNETSILASKGDEDTLDIFQEGEDYTITWHGQEARRVARSYHNLFKNAKDAYVISSTHAFPPEPLSGTRSPSPPVAPTEISRLKQTWFAYGLLVGLAAMLVLATIAGAFSNGGQTAPETTPPPTTAAPTTAPPTTVPPTTVPPTTATPTTAPPTTTPSPSALVEDLHSFLEAQGATPLELSLMIQEGGVRVVHLVYEGIQGEELISEDRAKIIITGYAQLVAAGPIADRLEAREVRDPEDVTWYCLSSWATVYNRGKYTLDDVYIRARGTAEAISG